MPVIIRKRIKVCVNNRCLFFIVKIICLIGSKSKQTTPPTLEDNIAASLSNTTLITNDDNPFKVGNCDFYQVIFNCNF